MTACKKEIFLVVVACLGAFVGQRVYANPSEVMRHYEKFDPAYTELQATVTKVTGDLSGNVTVTFHAVQETKDGNDKAISEDFAFTWKDRERPVPYIVGMAVALYCDRKHQIDEIQYEDAGIVLWRKRQDGFIEVVLYLMPDQLKKSEHGSFIRVFPNYVSLIYGETVEMNWKRGLGLAINVFGLGPGEFDASEINAESFGLPMANEAGMKIRPGKDGWRRLRGSEIESVVPFSQQIKTPG